MLTSMTSGNKLNQIKGPKNPRFVFTYTCMVRHFVLKALEDFSRDSELIKYAQKLTIFFYFFKLFQSTPTELFEDQSVSKKAMKHSLRYWNVLWSSIREPGYHHFVAIMETIFGQNPEVCEVKMGFSFRICHFHAPDPHQRSCRIVLNTNLMKKVN